MLDSIYPICGIKYAVNSLVNIILFKENEFSTGGKIPALCPGKHCLSLIIILKKDKERIVYLHPSIEMQQSLHFIFIHYIVVYNSY